MANTPSTATPSTGTPPVVVVIAVFDPIAGRRQDVLDALRPAIAAVHTEPGCILYAIHDAPDGSIVMIEKWESAQLLGDHSTGAAVRQLNQALDGLLSRPVEVTRLVPLPHGDAAKGAL
jgi:quinol monooxygenase YgiN